MPKTEKTGLVVSNKMEKTIVVAIEDKRPDPRYGKYQIKTSKFKAHDPENTCNEGDRVRIIECRPLSRDKHWQLKDIIERAPQI